MESESGLGLDETTRNLLMVEERRNNEVRSFEGDPQELSANDNPNDPDDKIVEKLLVRDVHAPNAPLLVSIPSLPVTQNEFFICASTIVVTHGNNVIVLSPNETGPRSALDKFLSGIASGIMAITAAPDAAGQALLDETTDMPDDFFSWLKTALPVDSVLVQGGGVDSPEPVSGFVLKITTPLALHFTTQAIIHAFPAFTIATDLPFGFLTLGSVLVLGLDSSLDKTSKFSTTLMEVLDYINMDESVLIGLSSTLGLQLDVSDGSRNALWFCPLPSYTSILRLQFTLTDERTLQEFVHNHVSTNLDIKDIRLIVRKRVSQFSDPTGYFCRENPGLMFSFTAQRKIESASGPGPPGTSSLNTVVLFDNDTLTFIIKPDNGSLGDLLGWLALLTPGADQDDVKSIQKWIANVSSKIPSVRELRLSVNKDGLQKFYLDLELDIDFAASSDGKVAFFVSAYSIVSGGFIL
jgi:hypothetical protein